MTPSSAWATSPLPSTGRESDRAVHISARHRRSDPRSLLNSAAPRDGALVGRLYQNRLLRRRRTGRRAAARRSSRPAFPRRLPAFTVVHDWTRVCASCLRLASARGAGPQIRLSRPRCSLRARRWRSDTDGFGCLGEKSGGRSSLRVVPSSSHCIRSRRPRSSGSKAIWAACFGDVVRRVICTAPGLRPQLPEQCGGERLLKNIW